MIRKALVWLLSTVLAAVGTTILMMAYIPDAVMKTALSGNFSVELLWVSSITTLLMVCIQQLLKEFMS